MSHPSLSATVVIEHLPSLIDGSQPDLSELATLVGDGRPIDLATLNEAVATIRAELDERLKGAKEDGLDDDQFEGRMAAHLHSALSSVDVAVLDDPGFWAYLACGPLWFFTRWREDPAVRKPEIYHAYVDGTKNDRCVPLRMFLRAQAVVHDDSYALAYAIPHGVDFWRSHILRVRIGSAPALARAVADEQRADRMTVSPLREYAKKITRRWSNQVLYVLDDVECSRLAEEERTS